MSGALVPSARVAAGTPNWYQERGSRAKFCRKHRDFLLVPAPPVGRASTGPQGAIALLRHSCDGPADPTDGSLTSRRRNKAIAPYGTAALSTGEEACPKAQEWKPRNRRQR